MKNNKTQFLLFFILFQIAFNISAAPLWQSNNIYLLHGSGYEVDADKQTTLTLEHVSGWDKGDLYFFIDITKHRDSSQSNSLYGEFSPRFSLGKITGADFAAGPVKDILIATTAEFGKGEVEGFLIGPGFDLNVPSFDYFSLNIYKRFTDRGRDGETIQVTPVWGLSGIAWGSKLIFEGYIDWNINNDGNYHKNIHINPRLKYDLGKTLNIKEGLALFGIEYSYWKNKYGIENSSFFETNQNTFSLFISAQF